MADSKQLTTSIFVYAGLWLCLLTFTIVDNFKEIKLQAIFNKILYKQARTSLAKFFSMMTLAKLHLDY